MSIRNTPESSSPAPRRVADPLSRLLSIAADVGLHERRAVVLAFMCNFVLLGSYYILRPVRDTVATIYGVEHLQTLFTATFVCTLIASPIFTSLASRFKLTKLLPGVLAFWLVNVVLFDVLFSVAPQNRWIAAAYYVWFSVANLFMISVFWSLMVDIFSASQATRLFALISAGGAFGSIAGPLLTRLLVTQVGLSGMLLIAAGGFALVIVLALLLIREKDRLLSNTDEAQRSTLDHSLQGNALDGFRQLFTSRYVGNQALFMLLMTWVNTIAYFFQTDMIAHAFTAIESRAQALADIDLVVNVCTAVILTFGLGRFVQRFGVTAGLLLNPVIMIVAFLGILVSPSVLVIQLLQVVRRVAQYAIARPSREICFTVVEQASRYKAKNVIDTVVYRFGDVSAAWVQAGMRSLGYGMPGAVAVGVGASLAWGAAATSLGRQYESTRRTASASADSNDDEISKEST